MDKQSKYSFFFSYNGFKFVLCLIESESSVVLYWKDYDANKLVPIHTAVRPTMSELNAQFMEYVHLFFEFPREAMYFLTHFIDTNY